MCLSFGLEVTVLVITARLVKKIDSTYGRNECRRMVVALSNCNRMLLERRSNRSRIVVITTALPVKNFAGIVMYLSLKHLGLQGCCLGLGLGWHCHVNITGPRLTYLPSYRAVMQNRQKTFYSRTISTFDF